MKKVISIFLLVLLLPQGGLASPNVPTDSWVYRDLDKLISHDLIRIYIHGQRPWSRKNIARMVNDALKENRALSKNNTPREKSNRYIDRILIRLQSEFKEELSKLQAPHGKKKKVLIHPLAELRGEVTYLNDSMRDVPGVDIQAKISPLIQYREGRQFTPGLNYSFESSSWLQFQENFTLFLQPRFQFQIASGNHSESNRAQIHQLYSKISIKNFELEIGRDSLLWGQSPKLGSLLSANPRPLDMVKISNDRPFFFPWIFKYLGAAKVSFIYSDLGPEHRFSHPYLTAFKFSLRPTSFLEFGLQSGVMSGGEGSPPASFSQRVKESIPVLQIFGGAGDEIGNKMAGLDFRLSIPPLRNTQIYGEVFFEDTHEFFSKAQWVDDAAYLVGIFIPRLNDSGTLDLRLEYRQTGKRFYTHGQYLEGWTLNGQIMGNALGPRGRGIYLTSSFEVHPKLLATLHLNTEIYSDDRWFFDTTPGENKFTKTEDFPEELRVLTLLNIDYQVKKHVHLHMGTGYEFVSAHNFTTGQSRSNFLIELGFRVNLEHYLRAH